MPVCTCGELKRAPEEGPSTMPAWPLVPAKVETMPLDTTRMTWLACALEQRQATTNGDAGAGCNG